jgi:hypothetical protein
VSAQPLKRLSPPAKLRLAVHIWAVFTRVRLGVHRTPMPAFVAGLGEVREPRSRPIDARLLSRAVDRCLRVGRARPRCIYNALVLYRLLHEQGDDAVLVIGLTPAAANEEAHAWVELAGHDVGPPPGRHGHEPLARFGR